MVRVALVCSCLAAVLAASAHADASPFGRLAAAPPPPASAVFAVSGRGWGHGVGMSQWGANGFAQRGFDHARILAHYYPGTQLGRAPVARVRVLLTSGQASLRVGSSTPFQVRDGAGQTYELSDGTYALGPGLRLRVDGGQQARPLPGPLLFSPGPSSQLLLGGKAYRGQLELGVESGRLRAINHVGLEAYLFGVVPDEMPHTWPSEALKAQAVVARSYALAVRRSGPFDLYDDVRSQVYNGISAEEQPSNAAVTATAGQVLLYGGAVARTYFFSTSGGRTADVTHVWGSTPIPYLVSVPDPYDSASPHHRWGPIPFTATRLGRALNVRGHLLDVRTSVNGSRRVDRVTGIGTNGQASATGSDLRVRLGLRSTWFSVGVLSLQRTGRAVVTHGSAARLSGVARGVSGVVLEQRPLGGAWAPAGGIPARGTFARDVRPTASTEYRLSSRGVRTAPVRLLVAPLVRLEPPTSPGALRGTLRPVLPNAPVVIQRRAADGTWTRVATARAGAAGVFEAQLELMPGTYRARVAPGRGFAVGVSAVLNVVAP